MNQCELSIIIPIYNAENLLVNSLTILEQYLTQKGKNSFQIILVLDASKDNTSKLAKDWVKNHKRYILLERNRNKGKGAAIREAVRVIKGDYVFYLDIDMSTGLDALLWGMERLKAGADIVIGSRSHEKSVIYIQPTTFRKILSLVLRIINKFIFHLPFSDTQCGFKGFQKKVFKSLMNSSTINRFMFDIELLLIARKKKLRIEEIPVTWRYNSDSTVNLRDIWRSTLEIVSIYLANFGVPKNKSNWD